MDSVRRLIVFPLCYIYGTIPPEKILWSYLFPFKFPLIFLNVCKKRLTQFREKYGHNTQRAHLCNRSPASPQEVLWPCLADLPRVTLYVWYSPPWSSFTFLLPSPCRPGNSCTPHAVLSLLSSTKILHYHRHFADVSVRCASHMGTWGWDEAAALQKPSIWCLLAGTRRSLVGRCMHPSRRLVPQLWHPIIWPNLEKAHSLHGEAVMSLTNWVTTAGHFVFFFAMLKMRQTDTEQFSTSDKGTEQPTRFDHGTVITSHLESIKSSVLDTTLMTSARVWRYFTLVLLKLREERKPV